MDAKIVTLIIMAFLLGFDIGLAVMGSIILWG
jgi:hypothetical protein